MKCSKCSVTQDVSNFLKDKSRKTGFHPWCRGCYNEARTNRMNDLEYSQRYKNKLSENYIKNREDRCQKRRLWRLKNKKLNLEQQTVYLKGRYQSDPGFRMRKNLTARLRSVLKGKAKLVTIVESIGCNKQQLITWIEGKFSNGMSWSNYGSRWHIDHIKPLCKFDLTKEEEQRKANHYTNLQPLLAFENLSKGGKWLTK